MALKFLEEARARRSFMARARQLMAAGKSEDETADELRSIAAKEYGDFDWGALVELILKIIALLFNKPAATAILLLLCTGSPVMAQCANGRCQMPTQYGIRIEAPKQPTAPCTPESCPLDGTCDAACAGGCACPGTVTTRTYHAPKVIRSTYAPSAPRWRPLSRVFPFRASRRGG